jgi:hypothetical protein
MWTSNLGKDVDDVQISRFGFLALVSIDSGVMIIPENIPTSRKGRHASSWHGLMKLELD